MVEVNTTLMSDPIIRTRTEMELYFGLAKKYCQDWHKNIRGWRDWYNFIHYTKKKLPYEERYSDPTPTNVVDLAVGILTTKPLEFLAKGWNPSGEEEQDSSRIEKYLSGTIYVNDEREDVSTGYEIVTHLVRDGAAVVYSVWDGELADGALETYDDPETGESREYFAETPVRVQVIDPLQMYIYPGGPRRWGHMFRVWEMTVHDVEKTWGKKIMSMVHLPPEQRMAEMVLVKDYWRFVDMGKGQYKIEGALMAHDEVLRPLKEMDGYEDLPYSLGLFKPTSRDDPAGWHSIIRPLEETVRHLESHINKRARQILVYTALPLIARTIPNRRIRLDPAIGNLVTLGLEESIEIPRWQGNAPDVEMHISFLRSRLQQAGFSDVMFGEGPNQISGFALSQLGDQNKLRLTQPVTGLERMWANWARKVLRLTRYFTDGKVDIRVYGRVKGQDFIQQLQTEELEHYLVQATVKPEFPNERTRNHAMASQVRDILSERTIMEDYLDVDQPDDERERRLDDQIHRDPAMVAFHVNHRLMQLAQSEDEIQAAAAGAALQQMQQGTGAGPGRPAAEGPAPQNATGLQSADGSATPQAEGAEPAGQSVDDQLRAISEAAPGLTPGGGAV